MDRIVSNLTRWEVGQDIISCYDLLGEKDVEIRNSGYNEESDAIRSAMASLAKVFNKNNLEAHGFCLAEMKPTADAARGERSE